MNLGEIIEKLRAGKKSEEIEAELPFALMHLRTRLSLGEQFESALKSVAESVKGELGAELKAIAVEISEKGASAEEAFLHSIERIPSIQFKRACSHIVSLYEQGFSRNELRSLKSLHSELLSEQRTKLKAFSGKMVVYSLMFVAFSTVLPSLFLAFILIGSLFLDLNVSPTTAFLIVIVLFPAIDMAVLFYIREKTPKFARS